MDSKVSDNLLGVDCESWPNELAYRAAEETMHLGSKNDVDTLPEASIMALAVMRDITFSRISITETLKKLHECVSALCSLEYLDHGAHAESLAPKGRDHGRVREVTESEAQSVHTTSQLHRYRVGGKKAARLCSTPYRRQRHVVA